MSENLAKNMEVNMARNSPPESAPQGGVLAVFASMHGRVHFQKYGSKNEVNMERFSLERMGLNYYSICFFYF